MIEALKEAFSDSIHLFIIVLIIYVILSFFEKHITKLIKKEKISNPFLASTLGLIPECGISVIAADLYLKKHITVGALMAVFVSCSDESVLLLFSNSKGLKTILPLLIIKFILGFIAGFLIDLFFTKKEVHTNVAINPEKEDVCCHNNYSSNFYDKHLYHPLIHSIKIFIFVLIFNIILNILIYLIGEDKIMLFLESSKYVAPIITPLIGVIPNCSSSIIITEFYLSNGLSFGAFIAGLIMNSGLGILLLFKQKSMLKQAIFIISSLYIISVISGYIICLITGF